MAKASRPIRWSVSLIRSRSDELGVIEAPDELSAIARAVAEFNIPPDRRNQIVVVKVEKQD
jgi:hypothetical protein